MAAKFEVSQSGGEYRWVLTSQGRTLATGESYSQRAMAEKAIESLRKAAAGATVLDLTLKPAQAGKPAAKATRTARKTTTPTATTKRAAAATRTAKAAISKRTAAAKKSSVPRRRTSKAG